MEYSGSLFWWIGAAAILLGIMGLIGMLAFAVDRWYQRHIERRHGAPPDDGRTGLWIVFEVLSAVLVVTSLLVAIYSDSPILRAVAGVALVCIVSAATTALVRP